MAAAGVQKMEVGFDQETRRLVKSLTSAIERANTQRQTVKLDIPSSDPLPGSPKMLVESLCVAQSAIGTLPDDYNAGGTKKLHIDRLQSLIDHLTPEGESSPT